MPFLDYHLNSKDMKARNIIGGLMAIVGIFVAVSVVDGSNYEIAIRFGGIVLFVVGVFIAGAFDFQKKKDVNGVILTGKKPESLDDLYHNANTDEE